MKLKVAGIALLGVALSVAIAAAAVYLSPRSGDLEDAHRKALAVSPADAGFVVTVKVGALTDQAFAELGRMLGAQGGDPETRADMGAYLKRRLGVDLLAVDMLTVAQVGSGAAALISSDLALAPRAGRTKVVHGVTIHKLPFGTWAATLGDYHVIGKRRAVKAFVETSTGARESCANDGARETILGAVNGDAAIATLAGPTLEELRGPDFQLQGLGFSLSLDGGSRLVVKADASSRERLLAHLEQGKSFARMGLASAKANIDEIEIGAGLGIIYADHHFEHLATLLTPREEGEFLVLDLPDRSGGAMMATVGILSAVAVPAFIKYMRRAKTTEALDELDKIYKGAAIYYTVPKIDRDGRRLPCQFPKSVHVTPVEGTCCAALGGPDTDGDERCDVRSGSWASETWAALHFQPTGQHHFVYAFDSSGTGANAQFTASAYADLDCDGVMSTFQRMGFGEPSSTATDCSFQASAAVYVENETE